MARNVIAPMLWLVVQRSAAAGKPLRDAAPIDLVTACSWIAFLMLILGVALIAAAVLTGRGTDEFVFRRHWGGFGGGSTGWGMSRPLMSLASGLALIAIGAMLAYGMAEFQHNETSVRSRPPPGTAASPAPASVTPSTGVAPPPGATASAGGLPSGK